MTYYEESPCLDLAKDLYSLEYVDLVSEEKSEVKQPKETGKKKADFSTNAYLFFREKDILKRDIINLCEYTRIKYLADPLKEAGKQDQDSFLGFEFGMVRSRICWILEKYHEQPALLGEVSKIIIERVMDLSKNLLQKYVAEKRAELEGGEAPKSGAKVPHEMNMLLQIIYMLIKIRGTEKVRKYFPHEARDFEPVIFALASQAKDKTVPWEANYVLMIWLSLILLMPFNLKILDSSLGSHFFKLEEGQASDIVNVVIEVCKLFLDSTTRTSQAAGICLARLFSRTDVKKLGSLQIFMAWVVNTIRKEKNNMLQSFFISGLYSATFQIFKTLNRDDLKPIQDLTFGLLFGGGSEELSDIEKTTTVRHYKTKLAQRYGLSLLPLRECKWVYRRTKKNLLDSFKHIQLDTSLIQTNSQAMEGRTEDLEQQEDDDGGLDEEVDLEKLEEVLGFLFDKLGDKDTIVRWSAAKGLGRITSRLDLDLANDIINEIVNTFLSNSEHEWQGGLLSLGELCRRGLLLPENLSRVVHVLKKGLVFEVSQGTYTSGGNVRDAACYVAWAFARAYSPEILQPYVIDLASSLLICALFDKEVTCRRAAAAAFQENVGRQGNFPHGIEIITEADYFSLAVLQNAYTNVAIFVASHKEYLKPFVEHLYETKLKHCNMEIRKLAAASLALLCPLEPLFMIEEVLPVLIPRCTSLNFFERHGALLGVSEVLLGLSGNSHLHCMVDSHKDSVFTRMVSVNEKKMTNPGSYMAAYLEKYKELRVKKYIKMVSDSLKLQILDTVHLLESKRLYRGKGGQDVRMAVNLLIKNVSIAKFKITKKQHGQFMDTLLENMRHSNEEVSRSASSALLEFSKVYHKKSVKQGEIYLEKVLEKVTSDPIAGVKRGYSQGLGSWSHAILVKHLDRVLAALQKNRLILKKKSQDDAETRKYAVQSLKTIFLRLGPSNISKNQFSDILEALCSVMDDYTVDRRGDIGTMVRETSMYSMLQILEYLCQDSISAAVREEYLPASRVEQIIGLLMQQLIEKIDKMRLMAGSILQKLFDGCYNKLPEFSYKKELYLIFGREHIAERIKLDQERMDVKFDISLVDTEFLAYDQNKSFVYFWNLPQCVFPMIVPVAKCPTYTYYILRGISLSAGGITLDTHEKAVSSIVAFSESLEEGDIVLRRQVLEDFIKLLRNYRRRERFITPFFNTLNKFYENTGFFGVPELQELNLELITIINEESLKTKYATKLMATTNLLCSLSVVLLEEYERQAKTPEQSLAELDKIGIVDMMSHLLNHEFPKVSKTMGDAFFRFLGLNGLRILDSSQNEALVTYISSTDWILIDIENLETLKAKFRVLLGLEPKAPEEQHIQAQIVEQRIQKLNLKQVNNVDF